MKQKFILLIIYLTFFTNNVFQAMQKINQEINQEGNFTYIEQRLAEKKSLNQYMRKEIQNKEYNIIIESSVIEKMEALLVETKGKKKEEIEIDQIKTSISDDIKTKIETDTIKKIQELEKMEENEELDEKIKTKLKQKVEESLSKYLSTLEPLEDRTRNLKNKICDEIQSNIMGSQAIINKEKSEIKELHKRLQIGTSEETKLKNTYLDHESLIKDYYYEYEKKNKITVKSHHDTILFLSDKIIQKLEKNSLMKMVKKLNKFLISLLNRDQIDALLAISSNIFSNNQIQYFTATQLNSISQESLKILMPQLNENKITSLEDETVADLINNLDPKNDTEILKILFKNLTFDSLENNYEVLQKKKYTTEINHFFFIILDKLLKKNLGNDYIEEILTIDTHNKFDDKEKIALATLYNDFSKSSTDKHLATTIFSFLKLRFKNDLDYKQAVRSLYFSTPKTIESTDIALAISLPSVVFLTEHITQNVKPLTQFKEQLTSIKSFFMPNKNNAQSSANKKNFILHNIKAQDALICTSAAVALFLIKHNISKYMDFNSVQKQGENKVKYIQNR